MKHYLLTATLLGAVFAFPPARAQDHHATAQADALRWVAPAAYAHPAGGPAGRLQPDFLQNPPAAL